MTKKNRHLSVTADGDPTALVCHSLVIKSEDVSVRIWIDEDGEMTINSSEHGLLIAPAASNNIRLLRRPY